MIVVAIIGLLAAIGIPSFAKARDNSRTKACVNNLRIIDAAKEQCAMEEDNSIDNAAQYIKGLAYPTCPTDGAAYTTGLLGVDPACAGADAATHNAAF